MSGPYPAFVATPQQIGQYLSYGEQMLAQGRLGMAELCAAMATHDAPQDAATWNLFAKVAIAARQRDVALRMAGRALEVDPYFKSAVKNRKAAEALAPVRDSERRFLVIREWGAGFWSDVGFVVAGCLLARITGREPVVWWGDSSLFRGGAANAWERFFEPVSGAGIEACAGLSTWPAKWKGDATRAMINRWGGEESRLTGVHHMARDERVCVFDFYHDIYMMRHWLAAGDPLMGRPATAIVRAMTRECIKPRREHVEAAEKFARERLGAGAIAVHLRGLDKPGELGAELQESHEKAVARVDALLTQAPAAKLLLLTDDAGVLARMQAKYGERLVTTDVIRATGETGLHLSRQHEGERLGREVLVDALIALHATHFVGLAGSNVSYYIAAMKDWGERCDLYGTSLHENFGIATATLTAQL